MSPTILTAAGRYFDLAAPEQSRIGIYEIAHALSQICRFTGHTDRFYSVAQHSVLVSKLVPTHLAAQGLMHDAHEAFIGDVAAPLKSLLPDYKAVERRVEAAVRARFNLPNPLDPRVKQADLVALATEQRDLMPDSGHVWTVLAGINPDPRPIEAWSPRKAREAFIERAFSISDWMPVEVW